MRSWIMLIVTLSILVVISLIIIFSSNSNNSTDVRCKETSDTVGEYKACIAFQRCYDEFEDNIDLQASCIADLIQGRNPF
ncbi:hypothetical protein LCGC14_0442570 [marine sediment metagenome]|uniref:Uncharacterized protein n=1 Tax=marine sediment metagenome TaxID=412755 RepID=A0A0F9T372_9ZZZZ